MVRRLPTTSPSDGNLGSSCAGGTNSHTLKYACLLVAKVNVDHIEDELKASKWLRRRIESAKPYIANAVVWINAIFASRVIASVLLTLSVFSLVFGIDWAGINWLPPERDQEAIAWERKLGHVVIATIAIMPFALALAFYVYLRTKRGQSPLPWWRGILVGIVLIGIIDWFR